jgi:hypothetical protein
MTNKLSLVSYILSFCLILCAAPIYAANLEKKIAFYEPVGETRTGLDLPKKTQALPAWKLRINWIG